MSCLNNLTRKDRSSTFGAYELRTRNEDVSFSQSQNLFVSPVRALVSGSGHNILARKRSSTWHGRDVEENQVNKEDNYSSECINAVPNLKEKLCQIITEEFSKQLANEKDLKSSQEFVKRSALISKIISIRARQLIGSNTKVVASVFIGEVRGDGIEVASQCLFDSTQDAFASGNFRSPHIFGFGTLFVTTYDASHKPSL